jgi:hypothetical protein
MRTAFKQHAAMFAVLYLGMVAPSQAKVVVESPGATVAGKTIAEWSAAWWQWAAAQAPPGDPFTDTTGEFAGVNQSGPVFFLAGSPGGNNRRRFNVSTNSYILVPLLATEWSQLELGFTMTAAEIRQAAQEQADQINSLHATLDGVTIPQATLFLHRQTSPDFNFVAVNNNQVGINEVGDSGVAVADGYFLMLAPLTAGTHVLTYGGSAFALGVSLSETDTITAVAPVYPAITTQPASKTLNVGLSGSFTVKATGFPLSYQWRKDGVELPGATKTTFSLPAVQTNDAGSYTVVVSNELGAVTSAPPAVLTVSGTIPQGVVVAWGAGTKVGTDFLDSGQSIVPVAAQSGIAAMAGGTAHSAALTKNGSVVVWGHDAYGQRNVPVAARSDVVAIAAGGWHMLALRSNGAVVAWGDASNGATDVPVAALSGVKAIAAGGGHSVALKVDGSVITWGWNKGVAVPLRARSGVVAIDANGWNTVALKNDGTVVVWGDNTYGQTDLPPAAESDVLAVAAGAWHIAALKSDGSVVAWGLNHRGQTDVPPAAQSGVMAIAAGFNHTVALKSDGSVVAWGENTLGQCVVPTGVTGVTAIAAGDFHTLALLGTAAVTPVSIAAKLYGNELVLSWPASASAFTLQSTTNLASPTSWVDSAKSPVVVDGRFAITNTLSHPAEFYRLSGERQ